jgi:hypothetical protein
LRRCCGLGRGCGSTYEVKSRGEYMYNTQHMVRKELV